jgi:hypothetical protein
VRGWPKDRGRIGKKKAEENAREWQTIFPRKLDLATDVNDRTVESCLPSYMLCGQSKQAESNEMYRVDTGHVGV